MITKMTKLQEKKVPAYLKKWLDVGYRTKSIDQKKARKAVNFFYEKVLKIDKPKYVIFLDSPMACQLACNLIKNTKFDSQLYSQLYSQLGSQLRSQLGSQLYSQLDSQLGSQLRSQLDSQLRSQLDSQLRSQLDSQLDSQLGSSKLEYFYNCVPVWYWSGYYGFYDFILNVLMTDMRKKPEFKLFNEFLTHFQELHMNYMFKDIVFLSDFPKKVRLNDRNQLHSFDSSALLYRDTYSVYAFNGVRVTKDLVETKPEDFTKEQIVKEKNADVRREIIRKIGMERLPKLLDATTLDRMDGYELISFDIGDGRVRPFLKMKNPSMKDVWHVEGVRPEIKTVKEALMYRNQLTEYVAPIALS